MVVLVLEFDDESYPKKSSKQALNNIKPGRYRKYYLFFNLNNCKSI
jgi:hypothetical protein